MKEKTITNIENCPTAKIRRYNAGIQAMQLTSKASKSQSINNTISLSRQSTVTSSSSTKADPKANLIILSCTHFIIRTAANTLNTTIKAISLINKSKFYKKYKIRLLKHSIDCRSIQTKDIPSNRIYHRQAVSQLIKIKKISSHDHR